MASESKSTDKLVALVAVMDKTIDKLPEEKISKIKKLSINWIDNNRGNFMTDHPLPTLDVEFYD